MECIVIDHGCDENWKIAAVGRQSTYQIAGGSWSFVLTVVCSVWEWRQSL